jgi:diguanylate cyclase (GGDEF)-like protein
MRTARTRSRLGVTERVIVAGAMVLALVGVLVGALLSEVTSQRQVTVRLERSGHILGIAHVAERQVVDLETGLRGFEATHRRLFLAPYRAAAAALPHQLDHLDDLVADNSSEAMQSARLRDAINAYITGYTDPLVDRLTPLPERALVASMMHGKRLVDALRLRFNQLDHAQYVIEARLDRESRATGERLQRLGIIAAIVICLSVIGFALWVAWTIVMPLRRGSRALARLAAGEHALRLRESGAREVRLLARAFNDAATQLAERERQLHYLADHDALTGLFNRARFRLELERLLGEARRYHRRGALLMIDLDGFKQINDRFGHATGDELVSRVAAVLRDTLRETDLVARLGGDEFAVVLLENDSEQASAVARTLGEAVRAQGMVVHDGESARVTTSIGITTYDGACGLTGEELTVEADIAMYDAKAAGRDRCSIYDRDANRRETLSQRHSWLERLRHALEHDGFVLHAQAITGICADGVPRYELLLRMIGEEGELLAPATFLYNAERFDLMGLIDRWVLRRAVALLHEHAVAGNEISLAVNISGKTMNDLDLSGDLAAMLAEHPVPEGRLVIEVTETAAIVNIDRARQLAHELRALGCRFALDDFGAGFASFYYLKHLDFDYLKIDGEFIQKLTQTATDQLVVQAVVDIARGLNTRTIAEFVEDQATLELLARFGVDYGQGFHLGRPGPLEERLPPLPPAPASSDLIRV